MFITDFINRNKALLIRMDDIAENMNWQLMTKCEQLFDKYNIKPLLGVIPFCKDPEFNKYQNNLHFWDQVRKWQVKGWEISMHGYNHLYLSETNKQDYFKYGGRSEFFGFSFDEQLEKIKKGKQKFETEGINVRSFFAPNHTYDNNTFKALEAAGITYIVDGYGLIPFKINNLNFIPQLFYKEIMLPIGYQATQMHINYWNEDDFLNIEQFIIKNHENIKPFDFFANNIKNNFLVNQINFSVELILKCYRLLGKKKSGALSSAG